MQLSRTAGITLARVDPALSMAIVRRLRDARLGLTEGPCGGTGRRARLKIEFRKECWFDSGQGHHASPCRASRGAAKRKTDRTKRVRRSRAKRERRRTTRVTCVIKSGLHNLQLCYVLR